MKSQILQQFFFFVFSWQLFISLPQQQSIDPISIGRFQTYFGNCSNWIVLQPRSKYTRTECCSIDLQQFSFIISLFSNQHSNQLWMRNDLWYEIIISTLCICINHRSQIRSIVRVATWPGSSETTVTCWLVSAIMELVPTAQRSPIWIPTATQTAQSLLNEKSNRSLNF